jgi:hypothetical protein
MPGENEGNPGNEGNPISIENWKDALPEDLKTDSVFTDIETFENLAKSYKHGQQLIGKIGDPNKILHIPDENDEEGWNKIHKKIGWPDNADSYDGIKKFDTTPEGYKYDDEFEKDFKKFAHQQKFTKKQAAEVWKKIEGKRMSMYEKNTENIKQNHTTEMSQLQKDWGGAFDVKLTRLNRVTSLMPPDMQEIMKKVIKNPVGMRIMDWVAGTIGEDTLNKGKTVSGVMTPAEADTAANKIINDKDHPYHKNDKAAIKKVSELLKIAATKQ